MYTNDENINDFINEYLRSRVISKTSVFSTIKRALEYEDIINKHFFEFSEGEILEMFKDANSRSVVSLQNQNVILKHATKWFKFKGIYNGENNYELITKGKLNKCVDFCRVNKMLFDKKQLEDLSNMCYNFTDKAILWLLFYGVSGDKLKELTFLKSDQLNYNDKTLNVSEEKILSIPDNLINILRFAFNETEMMSYGDELRSVKVNGFGELYKERGNVIYQSDDINDVKTLERRYRWVLRKLVILSNYFEVELTSKTLQSSGLWYFANEEMKNMGISDFKQYLYSAQGKQMCKRYGFKSDLYVQILMDKYKPFL